MTKRALALAALLLPAIALGKDFYVTPNGSSSGDGSAAHPWDLQTALNQESAVKGGDTVWVRAGTYVGPFVSHLKGSPMKPVVLRAYPGERVTIDGNYGGNETTLDIRGYDAWYWGLEVTNSDPTRSTTATGNTTPTRRGEGVHLLGPRTRLINMVIHDTAQGVLSTDAAPDAEMYGNLIFYNGWDNPDRGSGHGIYLQNDTGGKRVVDNVIFDQFGWGIHAYTEGGKLDNLYFEGNTIFDSGVPSQISGPTTDILVGANGSGASSPDSSPKVAHKTVLLSNYTYFSTPGGVAANLGYSKGIASPTVRDNVFEASGAIALINAFRPIAMTGNTFAGSVSGFQSSEFPSNAYFATRATGVKVFVRPNQYEPGRGNVTVYNWDRVPAVNVDASSVLRHGAAYEVRNAQNFYGPPVLTGIYDGRPLTLPLAGLAAAAMVGRPTAPSQTGPDFQVFVILTPQAASNTRPPVATFSFSPAQPAQGDPVAFHDASPLGASVRSWDFGDPSSGASNSSADPDATHSFSAPGVYTVTLTLANDGGVSQRTRVVTVDPSSGGSASETLPVAGHVSGASGVFVTDVVVSNRGTDPVSATAVFVPSGGSPMTSPLTLAPGETRVLPDAVSTVFGQDNAIGSLRIDAGAGDAVRAACRTYVQKGDGTLGFGAAALDSAALGGAPRFISNLAVNDGFRTNFGALNRSDASETFVVEVTTVMGNIAGRAVLGLGAGEQRQWALAELFPGLSDSGLTIRVESLAGAAPLTYAAVTDNASSDPAYFAALGPSPIQYLPGIAGITGFGGAKFRSELTIANSGESAAWVTLRFLEHDKDNSQAAAVSYLLGPREALHSDDALSSLFGRSDTYGALRVESDRSPGVSVFERILTDATQGDGTVGQQLEGVSIEEMTPRGLLLGIRHDDAFRSNIGFVNPGSGVAHVAVKLVRSPATVLGTAQVVLPPRGYVQKSLSALFPHATIPAGESLSVELDAGADPVYAFATVIDNVSQDPTTYAELP